MRQFFRGVGDLGRGLRLWVTSPRLMLLGAVPALIVGVVWAGLLIGLVLSLDGIATGLTPAVGEWNEPWRDIVHVAVGLAVLVVALVVAGLSFSAVTLTVGDPFYERISAAVEERLGDPPHEREEPLARGLLRAARDGLALLAVTVPIGVVVFLLGLVPVVGWILAFLFGATAGGWFLVVELTGTPFDVRGYTQRQRRRALRGQRARVLGFGAATWAVFLIPFGAVVAMPAAVGGATMLARTVLDRAPGDGEVDGRP